jgi:uncharacterized protein (DUF169 family)
VETHIEEEREKGKELSYEEMQDFFERTLKLTTPPVAVKLVMVEEKRPAGPVSNVYPITFCQGVAIARQGGYSLYLEKETISCFSARITFGLGTEEEIEQDIEMAIATTIGYYAPTREMASKIVMNKVRIPPGRVKGVCVAPLAKAQYVPDALIFTCFPWQAAYLTNGYLYITAEVPMHFETTANSLLCANSAGVAAWKKKINCSTTCTGGRAFGGTESTEVYWSIPWEKVSTLIEGLKERSLRTPYPSLISISIPAPSLATHFFKKKEEKKAG